MATLGLQQTAAGGRCDAATRSPEDVAHLDQRPSNANGGAGGKQAAAARRGHGDVRRDAAASAAIETPFLEPGIQRPPLPAAAATPVPGSAVAASRASSVAGTAAGGVPYSGKVDLELEVAVLGAGITGLATALALKRVHPRLRVKVFDRRPPPSGPDRKYGSYCRLEPNGLRAAAAIDPRLRSLILRHGLRARPVLIHDTDGSLITRLEERGSGALRRFGEPYVTIGWYELEQALLTLLPPGTVQYNAQYAGHRERDDATYVLFRPSVPGGFRPTGGGPGGGAAAVAARPGDKPAPAVSSGPCPSLVRAGFLVACDGPFSEVRKRVVRDGDPQYDGVVKWLGRLPGDDVPSLPLDFNAVWLSPGRTFLSHSLAGGDVAWEAVVTDPDLRELGFRYNTATKHVERLAAVTPPTVDSFRSASVAREPSTK
ncbi:hypothetical protein GPECTOR_2g1429 [Gonium pectorale]|uniref:FAD dependent oxidoreductase domain-containing protein n=1 Tax=Gonium pectorale TaxID=33097 RepID=A0A150H211_GONPE|nr:hypothetical protein GPECTOR_2g1429 [Gonium pectorale]|eukprot:KXZ55878.1 hypothetical protein GPECTOR_2g1429 [Gonium pectorale]